MNKNLPSSTTALNLYVKQVNKYSMLTKEEEKELGKKAKSGDKEAINKLIESNLRLVFPIAKYYKTNTITTQSLLDLIQEGNLGLYQAAIRFDVDLGYRFSTYATFWIRQSINQSIIDYSRTIRLPTNTINKITKINKIKNSLAESLQRDPTIEELSSATEIDSKHLLELLDAYKTPISLDMEITDDKDVDISDLIEDKNDTPNIICEKNYKKEYILEVLDTLSPREKNVIVYRFGLDDGEAKTLEEVGKKVGLTRERVRQIEQIAMRKLRAPARKNALMEIK